MANLCLRELLRPMSNTDDCTLLLPDADSSYETPPPLLMSTPAAMCCSDGIMTPYGEGLPRILWISGRQAGRLTVQEAVLQLCLA